MNALQTAFEAAQTDAQNLSQRPDNATLLKIYALYKQASVGDNPHPQPGFDDMVARFKWDAWQKLKGMSCDEAMQRYVELIHSLD